MLKGAPEGTITQIIFERLLLDNIRAEMITGKIVMIKPSRVLAIVLARAFKEHFLAQEEQKWERV
ncbi:MAG: hypothetical protein KBD52_00575 [Candidatus Pacebacteria bacterium]|nr:hypothetical protein [Candidatus Paceibacterota bacterium]